MTELNAGQNTVSLTLKRTLTSGFPSYGGASLELIHRGVTGSSP